MRIVLKNGGLALFAVLILVLGVLAYRNTFLSKKETVTDSPRGTQATPAISDTPPPTAPDSKVALPPERGHAIYRDNVENGWSRTESYAKEVDFENREMVRSGKYSIRLRTQAFDGIKFTHEPLNTHYFDRVTFYVHGGPKGGQFLQIGGTTQGNKSFQPLLFTALPPKKWVPVTIPLDAMRAKGAPDLHSFWIAGYSDKPQEPVYIDEVRLLKPNEPAPPGSPLTYKQDKYFKGDAAP